MGNVIIRSALVVACIGGGAFAVYTGLGIVFAENGNEATGPSRADKVDSIFSEPGTPPGASESGAMLRTNPHTAAANPYRNPVGIIGSDSHAAAMHTVASTDLPPATAVHRWWPAEPADSGFGIRHVGPLAGERAIAMFFLGAVAADTLTEHVVVRNSDGDTLDPQWQVPADNSRLALMPVPARGRYTLIVNGRLADVRGRALGRNLHGPIFVQ